MIRRVLDAATGLAAIAAGAALVLMMLHIVAEVILRSLFAFPLPGTIEIVSAWYMVAVVFLPLAMVERLNGHIVVELVSQHLPLRAQDVLIAVIALLSALYFAAFAWVTWGDALSKYAIGEVMLGTIPVTVWPTRFFLPVGCALMVLVLIYKSARLFSDDRSVLERPAELDAPD